MRSGRDEEKDNFDNGLINTEMLQELQDQFCRANNLYLVCMGKQEGVITQAYGSKEELAYIYSIVSKEAYMSLVSRMERTTTESMLEQDLEQDYIKMCAISTRVEKSMQLIWIVIGVLAERLEEAEVPECIMRTTEEHWYASVEFLSLLSRQIFESRINQLLAQTAMERSIASEEAMEKQLHRARAMEEVLRGLESDNGFPKLVEDILRETSESLGIGGAFLLRENMEDGTLDIICEYAAEAKNAIIQGFQGIQKAEVPFYNGKPYMISSDSMRPEAFERFMEKYHISAAVFQPVEANEKLVMYLGFCEYGKERIWNQEDVKFMNDVKMVIQSILVKRIAKNSLASSYASLEAILENAGCGICVTDYKAHAILYTNRTFKNIFEQRIKDGRLGELVFSEKEEKRVYYDEEVYFPEEERWLDVHRTQIDWVNGCKVSLCTLHDITDKKIYQKKIESQANNDFLTGLFNRMRCEQDLAKYITKAKTVDGQGVLLYIDLDDFKNINDGLGHQYGDVLLKAISHSMQRIQGIERTCYRMGGDEFIVIIPDELYSQMKRILQEITSIFTKPWFLKGEDYYCTMSMGVVYFPADGDLVEDLIRKADMTVHAAKKKGKNRIEYYDAKDDVTAYKRLDMEKNMRMAAMNSCDEFEVYYQPIVDVTEEGIPCCGAEALVRWNSGALGFVNPEDFIPLAEYLGLINPIGDYVLLNAAKRCKYWNDMGHPNYKVNVNLSVVQLLQNDIVKKIARVLEETRINPNNLTLEVTESLAINDMDRMKKVLSEIKNLGVRVALDDFGTGYSSLNYIREMPFDVIKIDRCFIEHLGQDDFSDAFVKMVTELANTIGVKVCVEGVETPKQRDIVKSMNVNMIQGYLFGKPEKIESFEEKYL